VNLSRDDFLLLRRDMISNILYTDIKAHFTLMKDFEDASKFAEEPQDEKHGRQRRFGMEAYLDLISNRKDGGRSEALYRDIDSCCGLCGFDQGFSDREGLERAREP